MYISHYFYNIKCLSACRYSNNNNNKFKGPNNGIQNDKYALITIMNDYVKQ